MNELMAYLTGTPGFKSAVRAKLDRKWLHRVEDIDVSTLSVSLPQNITLEGIKMLIGEKVRSDHNIQYLDKLPERSGSATYKYVPGLPVPMTVWVNGKSKLASKKSGPDFE